MSLNNTPSANRLHIGFFGLRNSGKSSLVNAVTGQDLAIVSDIKGTTTDPVYKAMEILPLGPVVIIDTPGIDDEGTLGELRVRRAKQVLNKTDIAVLVLDSPPSVEGASSTNGTLCAAEEELVAIFKAKHIPYIIVQNKSDLIDAPSTSGEILPVSAKTGHNINALKEKIGELAPDEPEHHLVADLLNPLDFVVLVVPIDKAAPKGRLILPQQQMIRDILEAGAVAIVAKDSELKETLAALEKKPALVITDSQVFAQAAAAVPQEIPLTSFSILFARYKGFLETAICDVKTLDAVQDGDKILICEGCTHHRQCDDIGTVKLPRWIKEYTGKEPDFSYYSGGSFPDDLSVYKMIIHCGGCMLNEREMLYRQACAVDQKIPFTNYGIAFAHIQGILERSIEPVVNW
ncbi:MAG: [FeFe] hydrogenase H-cluster maturation GTPase HydF [Treponema sp.]|jgi:[FeFe] hydrogenase H-cluster maturation GTPase HydF|nr:[FeFe] hydrogenase H-cluster maturation GTPase HydF [Treponema sp.]